MKADVLVCGAGPAGVTTALLNRTRRVVVLDPRPFAKPCGELVMASEAASMRAEVTNRSSYVRVLTPYGSREFRSETAMIDKAGWLMRVLELSGAVLVRERVRAPLLSKGRCVGAVAGGEYWAEEVYDCTGPSRALVSHYARAPERDYALCYEETLDSRNLLDGPIAYYDTRLAPGGYSWVFPRGDGTAYVGLATWPWVRDLRSRASLVKKRLGLRDRAVLDRRGSRLYLGVRRGTLPPALAALGEAGGSCDPYTGSGIFQAVEDARSFHSGRRRRSGLLRKLSATILRELHPAYLQALESVPLPYVPYHP